MKIPLLDLSFQNSSNSREILNAIRLVLNSEHYILGPEVGKFENEIAGICQCTYAIGVSSGTDALLIALMAAGIEAGDEIITTPYTFFATAGVIARLGAVPVFVDIDPATYNLDPALIESAVTSRTKAIIPVHLFGQCADMDTINEIAQSNGLIVVEDAAQAIGAKYKGKPSGSMGHLGCFSFFPSKNLGGIGDGGLVVTNDESLARKMRSLRVHGSGPKYYHRYVGGNFRLDEIQAAVLRVKLKYLDEWTNARINAASNYKKLLQQKSLMKKIMLPRMLNDHLHVFNQFVMRVNERDRLQEFLRHEGVATEVYYPRPLHLQECFSNLGYKPGDLPNAESSSEQTLAIPIYPGLTADQQQNISECIINFYNEP